MTCKTLLTGALLACSLSTPALAHEDGRTGPHAMDHAPIGVMADHRHKRGEVMVSLRAMRMHMDGSRDGTTLLSPDAIATEVPNRFAGRPGQPPTLRVVPTEMDMDMVMAGAMYGLSDRVTLMGMTSFVRNEMDHLTYAGGMGTELRGGFTTKVEGLGDSTAMAIIGLDDGERSDRQLNLNLGVKIPTGSNEETDQILTPMGGTPSPRLPYPMQLGTGTWDAKLGLTGFGRTDWGQMGEIGYGGQLAGTLPLAENDDGYRFVARVEATAWVAWEPEVWLSVSGRVKARSQGKIVGFDPAIVAPVQTADPDNAGGDVVEALVGVNLAGQGALAGQRLGLEVGVPMLRKLNGPQLETDWTATVGWQAAF